MIVKPSNCLKIIDYPTATSKFWVIALWAGRGQTEFFDIYYLPQEGKLVPVSLFYPEYYRSLSTRLYNFDGEVVNPQESIVISYEERVSRDGKAYKQITSSQSFPSYEAARDYLSSQKSPKYRIVSSNPFISPVPLEALERYKLVHSSAESVMQPGVGVVPEVKVFQYMGTE